MSCVSHPFRLLLGAGLIAMMVLLAAWPFAFSWPCRVCPNRAQVSARAVDFPAPGLLQAPGLPPEVLERIHKAQGLSLLVAFTPHVTDQRGPARIVSISRDARTRNLTLGQLGRYLVLRLRTSAANDNATDAEVMIPVGLRQGVRHTLALSCHARGCRYDLDGVRGQTAPLPGGDFSTWGADHAIVLGNEVTGGRPWRGVLSGFALYDRALDLDAPTPSEALLQLGLAPGAAVLEVAGAKALAFAQPARFANTEALPLLRLGRRGVGDYLQNAGGFALFAMAFAWLSRPCRLRGVAVLIIGLALFGEALQVLQVPRTAALHDLLAAWVGGLAGLWGMAWGVRRRSRAPSKAQVPPK